jgi:hypothetical protein
MNTMAQVKKKANTEQEPQQKVKEETNTEQVPQQKIKMVGTPGPADELYVDGINGALVRRDVIKLDCYRVMGINSEDKAEVRAVTHRLVLPTASVPELARLFQGLVSGGQTSQETTTVADQKSE